MKNSHLILFLILSLSGLQVRGNTSGVLLTDTIKDGQYFIDKGEANIPLMQIINVKNQKKIFSVKNKERIKVEVNSGLFDRYGATAEILNNNGKIKKLKGTNQFLLTVDKTNNEETLELKVTIDLKGDTIYSITREWTDKNRVAYIEKVRKHTKWEQTVWINIE